MKNLFVTSDWHCGHENVLKFCNRPFANVKEMHEAYIRNYNATVPSYGFCYFLGDFGRKNKQQLKEIVSSLNGSKILILGNHDNKSYNFYLDIGFSAVMHSAVIYLGNYRVSLSHCPLRGVYRENIAGMRNASEGDNWYGESRQKNDKFVIDANVDFHLHGHIHSPNGGKSAKIQGNQFDVGVDANGGRPVSGSALFAWMDKFTRERKRGV